MSDEVDLTIVLMVFDTDSPERLLAILSKYVVLTRMHMGSRVVDLSASQTTPGRFVVMQKWDTPDAQQMHFDSPDMVEMASACRDLLKQPPLIELLGGISAHDLQ
jgi:quinol monooxygenase YgiN